VIVPGYYRPTAFCGIRLSGMEMDKKTKSYDGENLPASAFLVVGDPDEPSTWRLPVRTASGSVDRRRMGAAKAALTAPGGHRGKKYAGPKKSEAIKKLRALYKKEEMIWEAAAMPDDKNGIGEVDTQMHSLNSLTSMVEQAFMKRYAPGAGVEGAGRRRPWIREVYVGHPRFGDAVVVNQEGVMSVVPMDLSGEQPAFAEEDRWQRVRPTYELVQPEQEPEAMAGAETSELEPFLETATAIDLEEASGSGARDPLAIRFVMIKPGFGNSRDGHFYPREVLERDAGKFVGAKMYATDHRADQRSVLTEVAVIDEISGFTDEGAPIAKATVWGPDFAEQVRNRAKAGKLDLLECSILGRGRAKKGKVDGRSAKIVQEIQEGRAVDWVSRAGAGGHALDISESDDIDNGGETVDEKEKEVIEESAEPAAEVDIQEGDKGEQPQEETEDTTTQEAALSQETVGTLLSESGLGQRAQDLLIDKTYQTEEEVSLAVQEMKALIKQATGAGKPFEESAAPKGTQADDKDWFAETAAKWGSSYAAPVEVEK